jgi:hypothetical protein
MCLTRITQKIINPIVLFLPYNIEFFCCYFTLKQFMFMFVAPVDFASEHLEKLPGWLACVLKAGRLRYVVHSHSLS